MSARRGLRRRLPRPSEPQTRFLQACLLAPAQRARALAGWVALVDDPVRALADPASGDRHLAVLLQRGLGGERIEAPEPLDTALRAASAHEQLRAEAFADAAADALGLLSEAGVEPGVVGEAGLAFAAYPDLALRHCHRVDLLVDGAAFARALRALEPLGCVEQGNRVAVAHPTGAALSLRTRLYDPSRRAPADLAARGREITVRGRSAWALAPADQLVETCAEASLGGADGLRWLADSAVVVSGGEVDWERVVLHARLARASAATAETLAWLEAALGAAVPLQARRRLARAGREELARRLSAGALRRARRSARRLRPRRG